mgnify:CR=1 FL=1
MKKIFAVLSLSILAWSLFIRPGLHAEQTTAVQKKIEQPVQKTLQIERKTQADAAAWRTEKQKKAIELEALEKEVKRLEALRDQNTAVNTALKEKVSGKQKQLKDIAEIENQISPFLTDLLARIKALKTRDLPFLTQERDKRIQALTSLSADPEIPVSEKFRKLMEALLIEAEYGQTIEVYQQTIPLDGENTLVNIFRLGRLRLFYQTLDRQACGFFNTAKKAWQPLPRVYLRTLQAAMAIGSKRKPVEILDLPIGRMVTR